MNYDFKGVFNGKLVKLLFEWKLRNVMDSSVLHSVVNSEEALEVLEPSMEVLLLRRFCPSKQCRVV